MKNIVKIIQLARPLYRLLVLLAGLIVGGALLELLAPLLSKFIVDEIVLQVQGGDGNITKLALLITGVFVASLCSLLFTVFSERLGDHVTGELRKYLTEKFYHKVLTLPQTYFDSEVSGKIINQLSRGIMSIQGFISTMTNFLLPMFLQSIFTLFVLAYFNVYIALCTFILFPIYIFISYLSTKKWGVEEVKKNAIEDVTRGRIREVISNIALVKSFNTQKYEYGVVSGNLSESNKIYAKQSKMFHLFDFYRGLSLHVVLLIINIIVFYSTFTGQLSIGEMVLILQLIAQARRPLFAISFLLTRIQEAESGSKEFIDILSLPSTETLSSPKEYSIAKNPTITFDHVSFEYEESNAVLKDVTFTLHAHEKVALVGHSGAGKSTIINLILKFYEATSGTILFSETPYASLDHGFVRHNISLVFQDNELFSSTVRENVSYGTDATEKKVIEALKLANAYDFVMKLPKGLDAEIGERGVKLSGGQKQRIQIARAILKNAPILILDEATSSLDAKSEKEVQEALENLMKKKLVIIIAHRFSTIQNVDKILVIDNGEIIDSGTPKELSTRKGIYSDLLHYQVEGNKKLLESFEIY